MVSEDGIDWSLMSWEGARRAYLRRWRALTLREKLASLESLCDLARRMQENRRQRGLPTVPLHRDDPMTRAYRAQHPDDPD